MTDEKHDIEYYRSQPEKYRILENGTVLEIGKSGGIVTVFPDLNPYSLTPERARELTAIKKAKAVRSKLKGMITGADLEMPADPTDDELITLAGDALAVYTAHLGKVFLGSKNVRGLAEAYAKLIGGMESEKTDARPEERSPVTIAIEKIILELRKGEAQTIEGTVRTSGDT